ncbi:hypothetical protein [Solitalea canadensis]|nr:hypothetical protein [Solitalea canadensis]
MENEKAVIDLVLNGQNSMTTINEVNSAVRALTSSINKMREADNPAQYAELIRQRKALKDAQNEMKEAVNGTTTSFGKFKQIAAGTFVGGALIKGFELAVAAVERFIGGIYQAAAQTQKFTAILENSLGSKSGAKAALDMLREWAAETPFSLEEATQGYIKLVNRGIIPTKAELTQMGDLAASQGKTLDQYIEAMLDGMTGEWERMKELGLRAKTVGDTVSLTFKGMTLSVNKFDEQGIQKALLNFAKMDGIAGSMAAVSKTIEGQASNLKDNLDKLAATIGTSFSESIMSIIKLANDGTSAITRMFKSAADNSIDDFKEQQKVVKSLTGDIAPLLDRYDTLKTKTKLTAIEQNELKNIIQRVSQVIPSAAAEFDKYGNIVSINTTKAREFIETQKAMLKVKNADAITENEDALKSDQKRLTELAIRRKSGTAWETATTGPGMSSSYVRKLTDEELRVLDENIAALNERIKGRTGIINELKGGNLTIPEIKVDKPQTNGNGNTEEEEKAKEKALNKYKELQQDIQKVKDDNHKLTLEKDQQEVFEVEQKYKKLRERAKGHANDILTINIEEKKELDLLKKKQAEEREKEQEKQNAEDAKAYFELSKNQLENRFNDKETNLQNQKADAYDDLNEVPLEERLEKELELQQAFALSEYELEYERLVALKILHETFGEDTSQIDKKIADNRIKESERVYKKKIADETRYKEGQKAIQEASISLVKEGVDTVKTLFGEKSAAYKAALVVEAAMSTAEVIMRTQSEIQGYWKLYSGIPGGQVIAGALTGIAVARAGLSIAKIAKAASMSGDDADSGSGNQTRSSTPKARDGALIGAVPEGSSHEDGGIDLFDRKTGKHILNMEGGEPLMVLSKKVYGNNKRLIDQLLYNSMYKNGAPVLPNYQAIDKAVSTYRNGGVSESLDAWQLAATAAASNSSGGTNSEVVIKNDDRLLEVMNQVLAAVREEKDRPVVISYFKIAESLNTVDMIRKDAGAR